MVRVAEAAALQPPAACLEEPRTLSPMREGADWRDRAVENGEAAQVNAGIARACQAFLAER